MLLGALEDILCSGSADQKTLRVLAAWSLAHYGRDRGFSSIRKAHRSIKQVLQREFVARPWLANQSISSRSITVMNDGASKLSS